MVFGFKSSPKPEEEYIFRDAEVYKPLREDVYQDMRAPLACYFVSSSHNTYLHGHQLVGDGGTDVIASCLRAGCRVVELDTYNGEAKGKLGGKGPQVRHGEALTSAVTFEDCMMAVRDNAFATSEYPVICTFENHCDEENQRAMARILDKVLGQYLYIPEVDGMLDEDERLHASPHELRRKVLIRTKVKDKEGKEIVPELARLVYIQNAKMKEIMGSDVSLEEQLAVSCSVEAGKIDDLLEKKEEVLRFTTRHLLRIYPQAWRVNSNNYDPIPAWNMGAQVVALNWQFWDKDMMLYETKFLDNGGCGYVKKPQWMIEGQLPQKPPSPKILTVRVLSAGMEELKKLLFKRQLDDLCVKVEVCGEYDDNKAFKTAVRKDKVETTFDETFEFHVHFPDMALLLVQLKDSDTIKGKDDVLGYFGIPVNNLRPGTWLLPLKDPESGKPLKKKDGSPMRWVTLELSETDDSLPGPPPPEAAAPGTEPSTAAPADGAAGAASA